jgi:hypothetical protein
MRRAALLVVLAALLGFGARLWSDWFRVVLPEVQRPRPPRPLAWVDPAAKTTSRYGWNPFAQGPLPDVPSTPLLEEAAVYSVVIDKQFLNRFLDWSISPFDLPPIQSVVIDVWTRTPLLEPWTRTDEESRGSDDVRRAFGYLREQDPALLDDSTFRSFLNINRGRQRLRPFFSVSVPYSFFAGAASHPPCGPFRQSHPGSTGIISFSRVGFNERHTQALVYAEEWCAANETGRGFWVVLQRSWSGWTIIKTFQGFNAD